MVNRSLRLREEHEIRDARGRGKAFADGPIVARIYPNPASAGTNRYAIIAGKVGKAHERNRCKRLVREAIRALHPTLAQGFDIVFIVRGGVGELTGLEVARASLERIFTRANMVLVRESPEGSAEPAT